MGKTGDLRTGEEERQERGGVPMERVGLGKTVGVLEVGR